MSVRSSQAPVTVDTSVSVLVRENPLARRNSMATWTTPTYTEINMSAEIGGYQDDFDERIPKPEDAIRPGDDPQSIPNEA
jgi:hypothetical protein